MELISYETIKEKINNYCENKLYIELYIKEQREKEKYYVKYLIRNL